MVVKDSLLCKHSLKGRGSAQGRVTKGEQGAFVAYEELRDCRAELRPQRPFFGVFAPIRNHCSGDFQTRWVGARSHGRASCR